MFVHLFDTQNDVAKVALEHVLTTVRSHEEGAIAIPTGKTPLPFYDLIAQLPEETLSLLRAVPWFALDEFLGADIPVESTFRYFLQTRFLSRAGIADSQLWSLCNAEDPEKEITRYEAEIQKAGGLSLAVLGIGLNGHIGFNEPGTPLDSRTGTRTLTEKSRRANAYLFGNDLDATPTQAITMGIGTIFEARKVILMATGEHKAPALARLISMTEPDPQFPASVLTTHPDAHILCDRAARGEG